MPAGERRTSWQAIYKHDSGIEQGSTGKERQLSGQSEKDKLATSGIAGKKVIVNLLSAIVSSKNFPSFYVSLFVILSR